MTIAVARAFLTSIPRLYAHDMSLAHFSRGSFSLPGQARSQIGISREQRTNVEKNVLYHADRVSVRGISGHSPSKDESMPVDSSSPASFAASSRWMAPLPVAIPKHVDPQAVSKLRRDAFGCTLSLRPTLVRAEAAVEEFMGSPATEDSLEEAVVEVRFGTLLSSPSFRLAASTCVQEEAESQVGNTEHQEGLCELFSRRYERES